MIERLFFMSANNDLLIIKAWFFHLENLYSVTSVCGHSIIWPYFYKGKKAAYPTHVTKRLFNNEFCDNKLF